jgi:hypothetical protein
LIEDECLDYQESLAVLSEVDEAIKKRIKFWSQSEEPKEWLCVLVGEIKIYNGIAQPVVTDFFEFSRCEVTLVEDIARLAESYFVIGVLYFRKLIIPWHEIELFLSIDNAVGRPLLYVLADSEENKIIVSFKKCWECPSFYLRLIKGNLDEKNRKGGEEFG